MTDPIDTARQEGIALGLAMAKAAPRYDIFVEEGDIDPAKDGAWIIVADIPEPPIPPHVAAARVLLDDLKLATVADVSPSGQAACRRWNEGIEPFSLWPFVKHLRAALEQIAGATS